MDTLDKWAANESLLQAYRATFISSQAFLLAVGAIVFGKSPSLVYFIGSVGLFVIWFIWFPVVWARHLIVDYYKYSAALNKSALSTLCSEYDYVHNSELRSKANTLFGCKTNWRTTRWKMDIVMPVLFSVMWLALGLHEAFGA